MHVMYVTNSTTLVWLNRGLAWFSDGPGRSQLRILSLSRLMDFIQARDVMTPLFFGSQ